MNKMQESEIGPLYICIGRFMICCDVCEEWYHGECVGVSVKRGRQMTINKELYTCPECASTSHSFLSF